MAKNNTGKKEAKEEEIKNIIGDITEDLEKESVVKENKQEVKQTPTSKFDFSSLSVEDMQRLKALLNATPDRKIKKVDNNTAFFKFIDDKPVVSISNCYTGIVDDLATRSKQERLMIDVYLLGEEKPRQMVWDEFMKVQRVACAIVGTRIEEDEVSDGTVYSQQVAQEIELLRTIKSAWYTVKFPNGQEVELEEKYLNL